jgi:hypothetical protein
MEVTATRFLNGGSDLEISKEMLSGLIMAQDIKVKN